MRNTVLKFFKRLRNKSPYRKPSFPYDMKAAIKYAEKHGKRVFELSDYELQQFLLTK